MLIKVKILVKFYNRINVFFQTNKISVVHSEKHLNEMYRDENQQAVIFEIFSGFIPFLEMSVPYAIAFPVAKN